MKKIFPKDFLWGVATSAFQLEGSPHADWATWDERVGNNPCITNHYALYKEDLKLLMNIGVNSYRFSVEWSRIQPREDVWDEEAIAHYQEIVDILRSYNIEPMITLHHFTHPRWFIERYPWHKPASQEKFLRLQNLVGRWAGRPGGALIFRRHITRRNHAEGFHLP